MFRYIIRRLLQMVLAFFGTTFIVFSLMFAAASDPVQALAGERPVTPQLRQTLTVQYHLDDPLLVQYGRYISGLLRGELGTTLAGRDIQEIITDAWPHTIKLGLLASIFVIVVGLAAGIISGIRRGGFFDNASLALTLLVTGIPVFVLGYYVRYLLAEKWHLVNPVFQQRAGAAGYLLPALVLAGLASAMAIRLTRTSVAENLRADYVRTAKAKGLTARRIIGVHVLRNSLIPVITFFGVTVGDLMAGAIVTERIFNIPGVGYQLWQGIHIQDGPTVVAITSILVVVYLLSNLAVDLLYAVLDPRIRYE